MFIFYFYVLILLYIYKYIIFIFFISGFRRRKTYTSCGCQGTREWSPCSRNRCVWSWKILFFAVPAVIHETKKINGSADLCIIPLSEKQQKKNKPILRQINLLFFPPSFWFCLTPTFVFLLADSCFVSQPQIKIKSKKQTNNETTKRQKPNVCLLAIYIFCFCWFVCRKK